MREATGPLPAMTGLCAVVAVSERVIAELRATQELIRRDMAVRGDLAELAAAEFRLAEMEAAYRRGIESAMFKAVDPVLSAPPLAVVPDGARHRHRRVPRPRIPGDRPLMQLVPKLLIPAAGLLGALKALGRPSLRHTAGHHAFTALKAAWASHPVGVVAGGTAATGATAALLTAAVVIVAPAVQHPSPSFTSTMAAPAASIEAAVPMTSDPPTAPVAAHAVADARQAGPVGVVLLAPPTLAPSSVPPAVAPTPTPTAGTLAVSATEVDLGIGDGTDPLAGTVTITARGGPVSFGAVSSRDADVAVGPAQGTLGAGQSVTLTFTVSAAAQLTGGTATIRVWYGSGPAVAIGVMWEAAPAPSPSASPAAQPTVTSTPAPSPVPSSS